jgi:uncharacterized membrane protein YwzB
VEPATLSILVGLIVPIPVFWAMQGIAYMVIQKRKILRLRIILLLTDKDVNVLPYG